METITKARERRDQAVEKAQNAFSAVLAEGYRSGLSLDDLHRASGLSVTTLRTRLKLAGVEMRGPGYPTQTHHKKTRKK